MEGVEVVGVAMTAIMMGEGEDREDVEAMEEEERRPQRPRRRRRSRVPGRAWIRTLSRIQDAILSGGSLG